MEKHWESWPDIPVPALRGLTPRQAAKNKVGREILGSLLLKFEVRSGKQEDESNSVYVARLRRELGLAKHRRRHRTDIKQRFKTSFLQPRV